MRLIRYTKQPELWANSAEISEEVWPEYNLHSDVVNPHWGRLFDVFPAYQFVLHEDEVLGEGHTAPCHWDGTPDGLGEGIDAMIVAALDAHGAGRPPNALCALAAEIRPRFQGRGLARHVIDAMAEVARGAGLGHLIAPVRPSLKERYPDRAYVTWTNEAGEASIRDPRPSARPPDQRSPAAETKTARPAARNERGCAARPAALALGTGGNSVTIRKARAAGQVGSRR